jgi:hypothetical protein
MRTIMAAGACVLLAFGAAFLVTRAVDHGGAARAAAQAQLPALPAATVAAQRDPALAAQFTPQRVSLRKPAKPRVKHRSHQSSTPASTATQVSAATSSAPAQLQPTATAPAYTAPAYTAPTYTSPPVVSQAPSTPSTTRHSSTTHHSSGSGSGTTVIGG